MKKKTRILLGFLSVMVVLLVAAYLLIPTKNSTTVSNFILQRRLLKLLVMVIVSCAIPISTISFQTVVQNRFLTPGDGKNNKLIINPNFAASTVPIVLGEANSFCVIVCINKPDTLIAEADNKILNSLGNLDCQNSCVALSPPLKNSIQEKLDAPTESEIMLNISNNKIK